MFKSFGIGLESGEVGRAVSHDLVDDALELRGRLSRRLTLLLLLLLRWRLGIGRAALPNLLRRPRRLRRGDGCTGRLLPWLHWLLRLIWGWILSRGVGRVIGVWSSRLRWSAEIWWRRRLPIDSLLPVRSSCVRGAIRHRRILPILHRGIGRSRRWRDSSLFLLFQRIVPIDSPKPTLTRSSVLLETLVL